MSDDATQDTPSFHGDFVTYQGRTMLRVRGAENDAPEEAVEDTVSTETPAPAEDTQAESQQVNWEERYQNLQPEFTRATQQLSELDRKLSNPETLRELLAERYGYEFEEEDENEDTPVYEDPYDELRSEIESLKSERQQEREQQEQARKQQETFKHIDSELEKVEKEHGELTDVEADWIGNRALSRPDSSGKPDVQGAYAEFSQLISEKRKAWSSGKKSVPAPGSGGAAVEKIDKGDPKQRREYMTQRFNELSS